MRVVVRHGHFAFYPHARDEVLRFRRLFKIALVADDDCFTFADLAGLPAWSQAGRVFGTLPATVTIAGRHAWEIMQANDYVFSLTTMTLVPRLAISSTVSIPQGRDYLVAPSPLVQPGSVLLTGTVPGNVLLGYQGELDLDAQRLYLASMETLL